MKYLGKLILGIFVLTGCAKNKTEAITVFPEGCEDTVFFSSQIQPLFINNCSTSGCHDQSTAQNGYVFETFNQIENSVNDALATIKHEAGSVPMPSGAPKLNDTLISQLECWIAQGKLNN